MASKDENEWRKEVLDSCEEVAKRNGNDDDHIKKDGNGEKA